MHQNCLSENRINESIDYNEPKPLSTEMSRDNLRELIIP